MIVYLNADGTIQQVVPQNLIQGSNNQKLIVIGANLSDFTTLSAIFKLPNQQVLSPRLMIKQDSDYAINNEIVNAWSCDIDEPITNFSGTLELTINANSGGVVVNSYTGAVQIAPANTPVLPSIDESSEEILERIFEIYGQIQAGLLSKQDIFDNDLQTTEKTIVGAINNLNTKENQNTGDILDLQTEVENIKDGTTKIEIYQTKSDNSLDTVNKTVVGGINELKDQTILNYENIQNAEEDITEIKQDYATKQFVNDLYSTISMGGHKSIVFDTKQQFLDWLNGTYTRTDGILPNSLNIGDMILIIEKDVPDYWVKSKSNPMTINDFAEYEAKITVPDVKIDEDSITKNSEDELQAVKLKNGFKNIGEDVSTSDFVGATTLTQEQYDELVAYGQIIVDRKQIIYDENMIYITPDSTEERVEELEEIVTELSPQVARALKTPLAIPNETKIVGVDTTNSQEMIGLGEDFKVENDTLKLTGSNISNPNLLINGDFRINQRGLTQYEYISGTRVYAVDRWNLWAGNAGTFNVNTKTLTADASGSGNVIFTQYIEDTNALLGKTLTMSAKIDGNVYSITGTVPSQIGTSDTIIKVYENKINGVLVWYIRILLETQRSLLRIDIGCSHGNSLTIDYAKLEIGSVATAFSPRPYAEELAMCQRYYQSLRVDNAQYLSKPSIIYPNINLLAPLRTNPTVEIETQPSVRGNGSIAGDIDNATFSGKRNNLLVLSCDISNLSLTQGQIYIITNGMVNVIAEIY